MCEGKRNDPMVRYIIQKIYGMNCDMLSMRICSHKELKRREEDIKSREASLDSREQALKIREEQIRQKEAAIIEWEKRAAAAAAITQKSRPNSSISERQPLETNR